MARTSWSTYTRAVVALEKFLKQFQIKTMLPIAPIAIALFVSHMHNQRYAASTIETYGSAIGYVHKLHGLPDPTDNFLVRKAIVGAKKEGNMPDIRLPITFPLLEKLVDALAYSAASSFQRVLFTSMYLLAFAAFLRVGEMALSNNNTENILKWDNLQFNQETGGIRIIFRHYKHSKGRQKILEIRKLNRKCPVKALKDYLELRGSEPGYLFMWPSHKPVTREEFCKGLKAALNFCGLDPSVYTSHSFRIGATCNALSTGHSDAQIREMGRWHSDAFKRYVRL
jgi:site-specific recombinase XerD